MPIPSNPGAFVAEWLDGWNDHDLDRVLAHFSDDIVFSSPMAERLLPESGGVIHGKSQLRSYWTKGLEMLPDLRFELVSYAVHAAESDAVVITYRNSGGAVVNEVLVFQGEADASHLVTTGYATH